MNKIQIGSLFHVHILRKLSTYQEYVSMEQTLKIQQQVRAKMMAGIFGVNGTSFSLQTSASNGPD